MATPLDRVQPPLQHFPTQVKGWLLAIIRLLLPLWLRWRCHLVKIETRNLEHLINLTTKLNQGKARYIMAFRHPGIDDQFVLLHLYAKILPQAAARQEIKFSQPPHSYFVYDRGIPLWGGKIVSLLFPNLGGISIFRGKPDRDAMRTIRKFLLEGQFPVAIAPEGGTNHHNELLGQVEPGVAQFGFWAAEDLAKANRPEQVYILPVGLQYEYVGNNWTKIDRLLIQLEQTVGLHKPPVQASDRYQRLYDLGLHLVETVGAHYQKFYGQYAPSPTDPTASLGEKIQGLLDHILRVAEAPFAFKPGGTIMDRCRRLEQAIWDRVFRSDLKLEQISPLEQGYANQLAKEAATSDWHMRIAESLRAITGEYVAARPSPTRFAEMLMMTWAAIQRVKNQPYSRSPVLGDRECVITIGEPICVSDRYPEYQSSRTAARCQTAQLTQELSDRLASLIFPSRLS
ncbi:MAG: 1-acyl-sn-glycerol-3-phosphate acyltransferase [Pseudanabaenaceae cyanobacterium bins.68]|nr:1-acyl-sn-glycerol-3-phosphate acyltransferase [Pseudanabaenaceae cyanobacterium bins.68]